MEKRLGTLQLFIPSVPFPSTNIPKIIDDDKAFIFQLQKVLFFDFIIGNGNRSIQGIPYSYDGRILSTRHNINFFTYYLGPVNLQKEIEQFSDFLQTREGLVSP